MDAPVKIGTTINSQAVYKGALVENTEKYEAIINAAVNAVAVHGFHGASMSLIADRAGVAPGTIYLHFESKDHLVHEAFWELARRCLAAVMKGYPSNGSIRQRFFHLTQELMRYYMVFPAEFLFVDQFLSSPYRKVLSESDLSVAALDDIVKLFREGIGNNLFEELPPAMLFFLACGPAIQVLRAKMAGILDLDDERISGSVKACWRAVFHHNVVFLRRGQALPVT